MSPLFAWMGAILGLLLTLSAGPQPGVSTHPAVGATASEAAGGRQQGVAAEDVPDCSVGWGDAHTSYSRSILTAVVDKGVAAWAVGLTSVSEDPRYPLAARWDGAAWVEMPIVASSAERALFGVDRSPTGRMWAAGYRAKSSLYFPMMMRWNGSQWAVSSLDAIDDRGGALLSVRAQGDTSTWAVGYKVGDSGQRPLAIRRVGTSWREFSPPIASAANGVLMDIDVRNSSDAWGVGWLADRGAPRPYLVHWDGSRWRTGTPVSVGSEGALTSVAIVAADDVWAVGYAVSSGVYRPVVQHWNGSRWRSVDFPAVARPRSPSSAVSRSMPTVTPWSWGPGGTRRTDTGAGWPPNEAVPPGTSWTHRRLTVGPSSAVWPRARTGVPGSSAPAARPRMRTNCARNHRQRPGSRRSIPPWAIRESSMGMPMGSRRSRRMSGVEPSRSPAIPGEPSPAADPKPTLTSGRTSGAEPKPTPRSRSKSRPTPKSSPLPPVVARDMAVEAGLARQSASYGAIKADFNRDGWPDLFIGQHANPGRLVFNDGDGTFSAAPGVSIPRRDRHGCTVGDANGDKRPDLYCANGALRGAGFKANEL